MRAYRSTTFTSCRQQRILAIFLFLFCTFTMLYGQSSAELAGLYRNNDISTLSDYLKNDAIQNQDWQLFVDALFIDDAETATAQMMEAYLISNDDALQSFIRTRISLFYAAKGYYETARKIVEDQHSFQEIVSIKVAKHRKNFERKERPRYRQPSRISASYGIQLGAFSSYENAEKTSELYNQKYKNTEIIRKDREGIPLYIVLIGSYDSRRAAEEALPEINQTFNVNGYIIQY